MGGARTTSLGCLRVVKLVVEYICYSFATPNADFPFCLGLRANNASFYGYLFARLRSLTNSALC